MVNLFALLYRLALLNRLGLHGLHGRLKGLLRRFKRLSYYLHLSLFVLIFALIKKLQFSFVSFAFVILVCTNKLIFLCKHSNWRLDISLVRLSVNKALILILLDSISAILQNRLFFKVSHRDCGR